MAALGACSACRSMRRSRATISNVVHVRRLHMAQLHPLLLPLLLLPLCLHPSAAMPLPTAPGGPPATQPLASQQAAVPLALAGAAQLSDFDPSRIDTYCLHRPQRLYDVAFTTRVPGRPHALRALATVLASAAVTNALRDARRVYIIVNNHRDPNDTAQHSALFNVLSVGTTSVHFLPDSWHAEQTTASILAMSLFMQTNQQLGRPAHGLLTLEDDIVFAPNFADRLQEALRQADVLASHTDNPEAIAPYYLMLYRTDQRLLWAKGASSDPAQVAAMLAEAYEQSKRRVMKMEQWSSVTVIRSPTTQFKSTLGQFMNTLYVEKALQIVQEKFSLPHPAGPEQKHVLGSNIDRLFSDVTTLMDGAVHMSLEHYLVQHTGVISARLTLSSAPTFSFARTYAFPYAEDYVVLDSNEEW